MKRITLDTTNPVWDRFFTVAPLVLIGTREPDGALDLAPKHMAMPMKPVLDLYETFPAKQVDGEFIEEAYLFLECRHHKTYDDFGPNCLITGEIVTAHAEPGFIRSSERDSAELLAENPLLAYVSPGRFGVIERTNAFPFPADMKK